VTDGIKAIILDTLQHGSCGIGEISWEVFLFILEGRDRFTVDPLSFVIVRVGSRETSNIYGATCEGNEVWTKASTTFGIENVGCVSTPYF